MAAGSCMIYKTCTGGSSKTWGGLPLDQAKSGLQKACRRGQTELAMRHTLDILFYRYADNNKAIAAITNLDNRLVVSSFEDVSYGRWHDILLVSSRLKAWREAGRLKEESDCLILEAVKILTNAKKSREASHIKAAVITALGVSDETLVNEAKERVKEPAGFISKGKSVRKQIMELLDIKHDRAFYLANQLMEELQPGNDDDKSKKKRSPKLKQLDTKLSMPVYNDGRKNTRTRVKLVSEAIYLLWLEIGEAIAAMPAGNMQTNMKRFYAMALNEFHMRRPERSLFLRVMMLIYRDRKSIDWAPQSYTELDKSTVVTVDECKAFYKVMRSGDKFVIAPEAVDQHTAEGRKNKKGPSEFANVGSLVTNLDDKFSNPTYAAVYKAVKECEEKRGGAKRRKQPSSSEEKSDDNEPPKKKKPKKASDETLAKLKDLCTMTISEKTMDRLYELAPRAQTTTATWKQRVVYAGTKNVCKLIYYASKGDTTSRLITFMQRTAIFKVLNEVVAHDIKLVHAEENPDKFAIYMGNLATKPTAEWKKIPDGDKETEKNRIDRESTGFIRVSDLPDEHFKFAKLVIPVAKSLAIRSVLGIGDTGRHNLGVQIGRESVPIQLDYEEDQKMDSKGLVIMREKQHPLASFLSHKGMSGDLLEYFKSAVTNPTFTESWAVMLKNAEEQLIPLHTGRLAQFAKIIEDINKS